MADGQPHTTRQMTDRRTWASKFGYGIGLFLGLMLRHFVGKRRLAEWSERHGG